MFVLITNNAELYHSISAGEYINGSSLDVLIHVRSLVHLGSILLTHPLCGNLRPNHQPYRSVIIDDIKGPADLESLTLIESAIRIYESSPKIIPSELNEASRKDYAYIDSELMRESLTQYGLIRNDKLCAATLLLQKEEC